MVLKTCRGDSRGRLICPKDGNNSAKVQGILGKDGEGGF